MAKTRVGMLMIDVDCNSDGKLTDPIRCNAAPNALVPNSGNGYDFGDWSWVQSLQDVTITVPVPAGTKARDVDVLITKSHIRVRIKSKQDEEGDGVIIDDKLHANVLQDESFWNISKS